MHRIINPLEVAKSLVMKHAHSKPEELLPVGEYYFTVQELEEFEAWLEENWWKVSDRENGKMFVPQCQIKVQKHGAHCAKVNIYGSN